MAAGGLVRTSELGEAQRLSVRLCKSTPSSCGTRFQAMFQGIASADSDRLLRRSSMVAGAVFLATGSELALEGRQTTDTQVLL